MSCLNLDAGYGDLCQNNKHLDFLGEMIEKVKGQPIAKVLRLICKQHTVEAVDLLGPGQYFQHEETGEEFKYRVTFKDRVRMIEDYAHVSVLFQDHYFYFNLPQGVNIF